MYFLSITSVDAVASIRLDASSKVALEIFKHLDYGFCEYSWFQG